MKALMFLSLSVTIALSACVLQEPPCEDVTVAAEELQQCKVLSRQIAQAKGNVVIRSELERRYQQDCVETRYYRDSKQEAVCGNKQQIKAAEEQRAAKIDSN